MLKPKCGIDLKEIKFSYSSVIIFIPPLIRIISFRITKKAPSTSLDISYLTG